MKKLITLMLALAMLAMALPVLADGSTASDKESIEAALNLANNPNQ